MLSSLVQVGLNQVLVTCYDGIMPQHIKEIQQQLSKEESHLLRVRLKRDHELDIWNNRAGTIDKFNDISLYSKPCYNPSGQIVIDYSGKVPICCDDFYNKITLGDVNKSTLVELWNSSKAKEMRKALRQGKRHRFVTCANCDNDGDNNGLFY